MLCSLCPCVVLWWILWHHRRDSPSNSSVYIWIIWSIKLAADQVNCWFCPRTQNDEIFSLHCLKPQAGKQAKTFKSTLKLHVCDSPDQLLSTHLLQDCFVSSVVWRSVTLFFLRCGFVSPCNWTPARSHVAAFDSGPPSNGLAVTSIDRQRDPGADAAE